MEDKTARDQLWLASFQTMYDSGYNELVAVNMFLRWRSFDDWTKILVALTSAGSSGLAGLAIWSQPVFKQIWAVAAAISVTLAAIAAKIGATDRVKVWGDSKSEFGALYVEMETFMFRMKINPSFAVAEYNLQFEEYRKKFASAKGRIPTDWLASKAIETKSQQQMNDKINQSTIHQNQTPPNTGGTAPAPVQVVAPALASGVVAPGNKSV